jgi:hypothetical protein
MVCDKTCKWICIVAYIISAISAIVCSFNHLVPSKKIDIPKAFSVIALIGGLVTLICGIRWALRAEGKSVL